MRMTTDCLTDEKEEKVGTSLERLEGTVSVKGEEHRGNLEGEECWGRVDGEDGRLQMIWMIC